VSGADPGRRGLALPRLAASLSRPIVALLALQMLGGLILSPSRTFFPIYLAELGHPALFVGLVVAGQQVMGLLASWIGGALSDSLGRKPTLLLGQLGELASVTSFLVASPVLIVSLRALGGFCGGLHTVAAQSYLVHLAPATHLGLVSAFFNWGYTLGGALSSPIAGLALERWGYRELAWGLIVCAMVALAITQRRLPSSARRAAPSGRPLWGYGELLRRPSMRILAMMRFLPTFYWGTATVLIPLMLHGAGASKMLIAIYATVSQVAASLAQVAAGRAADRLSLHGTTLCVVSALLLSILGLSAVTGRLWGVFLLGTLSTAAAWSLSTLMPSLVARATQPAERGRALGWVHLWWNLGMVLGSMAAGAFVAWHPGLPFWIAGLLNLGTLGLAVRFFRSAAAVRSPAPASA